jgi:23S rRNA (guanosine2251-2'-O)-methyltransferase
MSESVPAQFCIYQCIQNDCALRFPAGVADAASQRCPNCRAATIVVEAPYSNQAAPVVPAVPRSPLVGVLDNLRSTFNVGSIFRSAEGAGFTALQLLGITPTPLHPKLAKTALGAESYLAWESHRNGLLQVQQLKAQGFILWALETRGDAQPWRAIKPPSQPLALVVGNEIAGVDPAILRLCDRVLFLPMLGQKLSLNVAVAFGVAAYQLRWG